MNSLTVVLSTLAELQLLSTLAYIEKEWSKEARDNMLHLFVNYCDHIAQFPKSHPIIDKRNDIHRAVVSRHMSLYYQINDEQIIEIILIIDNRQDPDKIATLMKKFR